jgi:hypothetical protein
MGLAGSWFTRASQNARVFVLQREWSQLAADAGTMNGSSLGDGLENQMPEDGFEPGGF